ncbi:polynucleotidyl transferase Ribonuclease H fold [Trifolium medium]|uniref:Polynucleotidyl transferase Ribonuclease H fold n=1 Tax=Trifolium medium TaxID=97028 RepID=A0A392RMF5_9FABA|nr:polynucleotidyl transferase Ribonuclease H fold [Trifolium medium]
MIWNLWNNRNSWIWNNEKLGAQQLSMQAVQGWNEWFFAQRFNQHTVPDEQIQQHEVWQPPMVGWLKCNVDAGFHDRGRTTNRGWCVTV